MKTFLTLSLAFAIHSFATAQNIPDANFAQAILHDCPVCIDANNNLTPAADTLTYLDVSNQQINDLSGIAGFDNLQTLIAVGNSIDFLPTLPVSLRLVNVFDNEIYDINSLSNLPNLEILNASLNLIRTIPLLSNSVKEISLASNGISLIQNIPPQLSYLDISNNNLSNLPTFGDSLTYLVLSHNQFDTLNIVGADNLETLFATFSAIQHIGRLPAGLKFLNVDENELSTLPSLPVSLKTLSANYNQLNTIDSINRLINLKTLSLEGNQLSILPNLPSNLEELHISNNNLTILPTLPALLRVIYFYNNRVSQWPSFGDSIRVIQGYNNQLRNINILPDSLRVLNVAGNSQLSCLPIIPLSTFYLNVGGTNINCIPNLPPRQFPAFGLPVCNSTNNTNNCLILSVEDTPAPTFMVSPNPFHNYLTVQNSELLDDNSQLFLYNNLGQLVKQQQLFSNNENIDVSDLQPAVYYLVIKTQKGSFSQKIVKQ